MAERTMKEIKKIEQEIYLALQVLRKEIETLTIIKNHTELVNFSNETNTIIQDELAESVNSMEQLMSLHKNLENQIQLLEVLLQDLLSIKA